MVWVTNAKKIDAPYQLHLEFNDGLKGLVDLKKVLENDHRPIVRELLNIEVFNAFEVENDTVCWKNGVDFAPEFLYEMTKNYKQAA